MLWTFFLLQITCEQSLFYSAFVETTLINLEDWQIIGINSSVFITQCGSHSIVGGYDLFSYGSAATKFIKLPPHYKMKITFTLFIIDTWDDEYFYLYVDQNMVFSLLNTFLDRQQVLCGQSGNNRKDQSYEIESEFDHTGQTSYIQLTSNLNDNPKDESWGFRNFRIFLYLCPPGCQACTKSDSQPECQQWILFSSLLSEEFYNLFQQDSRIIILNGASTKSQCAQIPIICGYGSCGRNTVLEINLQLPFHSRMKIKLMYLKIDAWENTKSAFLEVDGIIKWNQQLSTMDQYLQGVCGGTSKETFYNLELTFSHIQTQTKIQILNNLDQDFTDESFGIRDIEIFIQQSLCGDQIIQEQEECDDGNLIPFDGCFSCKYSCVDGCSTCNKGICISCLSGWRFKKEISSCQLIDNHINYLYEKEICLSFKEENCLLCQNGFQINKITNQCEQINYESLFNSEAKIKQICLPQCELCIEEVCYKCQTGAVLILGQCLDPCKYTTSEFESLEQCGCDVHCIDCSYGVCYECQGNHYILDNKCVSNICGDQFVYGNEDCDDGNTEEYDGCFDCLYSCSQYCDNCQKGVCLTCQDGYSLKDNICSSFCGDFIVTVTEQCEDGNNIEYDGCYECKYSCPLNCENCFNGQCLNCDQGFNLFQNSCSNICGDGILTIKEQCDDSNQNNGDGCSKNCEIEQNWICSKDGQCSYVKYPLLIIEYIKQENQYQYVKIRFSQNVQQEKSSDYKETIQLQILELDQNQYKIIIQEVNAAQFQILSDVQYILQIEILTTQQQHPILEVQLTEQLYNENQAPLMYLGDYLQLKQAHLLSEEELQSSIVFLQISTYSANSLFAMSGLLFFLGNYISFWGILDVLQEQSYLKFLNVQYPQTLIIYFQSSEAVSMSSILLKFPILKYQFNTIYFSYEKSYEKFEYYEINANIMEGIIIEVFIFSSLIIVYLSTLFTFCLLKELEISKYLQQWPRFILSIQKLKRFLNKKLKLINFKSIKIALLACSWDLIFMTFLELKVKHRFVSSEEFIRLAIAYMLMITISFLMLDQIEGPRQWKKQNFIKFWDQKQELFILLKKTLILYVLVFYQHNQIIQTMVLTLVNTFYFLYVIYFKQVHEKQEYIKNIISEILLTLFTASTFVNWDVLSNYFSYEQKIIIGWVQMSLLTMVLIIFFFIESYNFINQFKEKINIIIIRYKMKKKSQQFQENQDEDSLKPTPNNLIKKTFRVAIELNQMKPNISKPIFGV